MTYDFIIVGAGSAGCVMAERLSRDGRHRVLLVEAGGAGDSMFVHMPRGVGRVMGQPDKLWLYQPDKVDAAPDEGERWVRGRMLGGSSAINGMIYNRGQQEDWDALEAAGCHGWGWSSVLPYFKAVEDQPWGAGEDHGSGGPLHISRSSESGPFDRSVIEAGKAMGLAHATDLNAPQGGGVIGHVPRTIRKGRRWSTAEAFLKPALHRPNLTLATGATVERVVIEDGRAVGIACGGALTGIQHANREVLLCAGGLESPRLLQLSGVGPVEVLKAAGVVPVRESPEVGRNLIEHRCITMRWRTKPGYSANAQYRGIRLAANALRWMASGGGPFSAPYADIAGFMRIAPAAERPDAMLFAMPYSIQRNVMPIATETTPGISMNGYTLRPESRGHLAIASSDPRAPLRIDPNYLATPGDRALAVGIVRFIRALAATPSMAPIVEAETFPGPAFDTDDEILGAWHRFGHAGYHLVGTCRMGCDRASVVDPDLRVRGVDALRVVDCSIFPTMISGNTNGPVIAVAARAADLILKSISNAAQAA